MIQNHAKSPNAEQFRRITRILYVTVALYVPVVAIVGFGLDDILHSALPFAVTAIAYLAIVVVLSVRTFSAYYRWKGKYPFYWLRK